MFPNAYYGSRYWPDRYFPKVGAESVLPEPILLTLPARDFSLTMNDRDFTLTLPNRPEEP